MLKLSLTSFPLVSRGSMGLMECFYSGTLLAYSIVSASLVILRYQPSPISAQEPHLMDNGIDLPSILP